MALWTPAEIETALWLDASDTSTVQVVSGAVSQWADKSSNGNDAAQSVVSQRPEIVDGAVVGDGTDDILKTPYRFAGVTSFTLFAVIDGEAGKFFGCYAASSTMLAIGVDDSSYTFFNRNGEGSNPGNLTLGSVGSTDDLLCMTASQNTSSLTCNSYMNGTPAAVNQTYGYSAQLYKATDFGLCGVSSATAPYCLHPTSSKLREIVVIEQVVADETRQLIEGYLAHKWGLDANLPSNHPYKDLAPGETPAGAGSISGVTMLDGAPVQANLYLADLAQLPTVTSDSQTGAYTFEDPGDHSVIPDSDQLIVLCHYGPNVRPLAHGPVIPVFAGTTEELWTPDELMTALWLDAADADTITANSGFVSQWSDKSGNGRNATQSASEAKPLLVTGNLGGKDVISFDGTDFLQGAGAVFESPYKTSVFVVALFDDNTSRRSVFDIGVYKDAYASPKYRNFIIEQNTYNSAGRYCSYISGRGVDSDQVPTSGAKIFNLMVAATPGTSILGGTSLFISGEEKTLDYTSGTLTTFFEPTGLDSYCVGKYNGIEVCYMLGDIAEILVVPTVVSEEVRQRIEGYLSHKWGLQDNLPSDHPYKLSAPIIEPMVDEWWEHVVLRMPFDGTIEDVSNSSHAITVEGDAEIRADQFMSGSGACYFDGAGDYLSFGVPVLPATDAFTLEFWVRPVNRDIEYRMVSQNETNPTGRFTLSIKTTGQLALFIGGTGGVTTTSSLEVPVLKWSHIALVKVGSTYAGFVNGVQCLSAAGSLAITQERFFVGYYYTQPEFLGYIDDFRITKGVARYTSDFIPPKRQLPIAAPEAVGDEHWANVALLLPMNGTDGQTVFNDVSQSPKTITRYGDTVIKTDQWRFGGSAAYFDGSGDYMTINYDDALNLASSQAFTIEVWVYFNDLPVDSQYVISKDRIAGSVVGQYTLFRYLDGQVVFRFGSGTSSAPYQQVVSVTPVISNAWIHLAAVLSDGNVMLFVDGVLRDTTQKTVTMTDGGRPLFIGSAQNEVNDRCLNGYIDDFRITKGVARYTEDFTPPVRGFPNYGV